MTFKSALRKLPDWAKGLATYAVTVVALRDAVLQELEMYREGINPLTDSQVKQLQNWLEVTK